MHEQAAAAAEIAKTTIDIDNSTTMMTNSHGKRPALSPSLSLFLSLLLLRNQKQQQQQQQQNAPKNN